MPSELERAVLVEMQIAIADIRSFVRGVTRDVYLADREKQMAVAMGLVIIGESARRLSAETQAKAADLDWSAIISLRNRIAHGYGSVDHRLVWSIVEMELDRLADVVERLSAPG